MYHSDTDYQASTNQVPLLYNLLCLVIAYLDRNVLLDRALLFGYPEVTSAHLVWTLGCSYVVVVSISLCNDMQSSLASRLPCTTKFVHVSQWHTTRDDKD